MNIHAPLPKDTSSILSGYVSITSNFGLLFNKYVYTWPKDWKMKEDKKDFLNKIRNTFPPTSLRNELAAIKTRQKNLCNGFKEVGWFVKRFELKTQSRLILGLGGTNVLETGMTLHPLYGFPYIPASGLKGLARAYAEISHALSSEEILDIFGSENKDPKNVKNNRQGKVIFLDSLPERFPELDLDVMNPHYSEYYQGKKGDKGNIIPPADYLNPLPIFFIAVAPGEKFSFAMFSREVKCVEKAEELLIKGLTELGAGGKTNVGYGYFQQIAIDETTNSRQINVETSKEVTHKPHHIEIVKKTFKGVTLNYNPGNRSLTTTVEGKKAFVEHIDDKFVPEHLWPKLKKNKAIKATIVVEPIGNNFKIVALSEE